jgi:hypothetical protein
MATQVAIGATTAKVMKTDSALEGAWKGALLGSAYFFSSEFLNAFIDSMIEQHRIDKDDIKLAPALRKAAVGGAWGATGGAAVGALQGVAVAGTSRVVSQRH